MRTFISSKAFECKNKSNKANERKQGTNMQTVSNAQWSHEPLQFHKFIFVTAENK